MTQKSVERKALLVSSIVNLIITLAGFWVFTVTHIQALFLDFFFSLIALVSSVLAVIISKASKRKTAHYPDGIYFLEPLYAIVKSLLTLSLLIISVASTGQSACEYFVFGIGSKMNTDPVLPYTIGMVILCFGLGLYNMAQNRKINNISTILTAESRSNFIDGLQSLGVGVAIVLLYFVDVNGSLGFMHFTGDFFITVTLVLISFKEPAKVLINSFKELSGGITSDTDIKNSINKTINAHLDNIVQDRKCEIFKIGMHIKVRVTLPNGINHSSIPELLNIKKKITDELRIKYENLELAFIL